MIYKLDTLTVFPRYEIISVKYDIVKGSISYLPLKFIQFLSITTKDLNAFLNLLIVRFDKAKLDLNFFLLCLFDIYTIEIHSVLKKTS